MNKLVALILIIWVIIWAFYSYNSFKLQKSIIRNQNNLSIKMDNLQNSFNSGLTITITE